MPIGKEIYFLTTAHCKWKAMISWSQGEYSPHTCRFRLPHIPNMLQHHINYWLVDTLLHQKQWWYYKWNPLAHMHQSNIKPSHLLKTKLCTCTIPSNLWYKSHLRGQWNCRSLRCSWSIACRRCSNHIHILDLIHGFNRLGKDNFKAVWESL